MRAALPALAALAALIYLIPTFVAVRRDVAARSEVVLLNVCLGWTGVAWLAALVLAFGTRRPRPVEPSPTRPPPRPQPPSSPQPSIYRDGAFLVSSGPDTHTWAIRKCGRWTIVYEAGGVDRLVGDVDESDVPLGVLAQALDSPAAAR